MQLIACADVAENEVVQVCIADREPVAVYNVAGEYFVTDDTCTHGLASLADGEILPGGKIECPFHTGTFDIRTGEAVQFPCTEPLTVYPVQIIDGFVCADLNAGHTV